MKRVVLLISFAVLLTACSEGSKELSNVIEPAATTQPAASYPITSQQNQTKDVVSCDDLFVNAKEIDADDYFRKLRNEALDEPYWRDTYWFKADNGKLAKNGPRMTWVYEAALDVALNYVPPAAQEGSFINFEGKQLLWGDYLAFKQSLCDAYYEEDTKRRMIINLEILFDYEIDQWHVTNWPIAFEYIETGPKVIQPVSPPGLEYYTKYIAGGGVMVTAGSNMPDVALLAARESILYMTSARPEFRQILQDNEVRIGLFIETADELPEFTNTNEEGGFAMGATDSLMTAAGLWQCYDGNKQFGGNPVIHELVHTMNHIVFESINEIYFYERIYDIALASIQNGIFYTGFDQNLPDGQKQDMTNFIGEFWAISVTGYIMDGGPAFKDSHYSHDWIKENDPYAYDLITRYFPTEKWNYCDMYK